MQDDIVYDFICDRIPALLLKPEAEEPFPVDRVTLTVLPPVMASLTRRTALPGWSETEDASVTD